MRASSCHPRAASSSAESRLTSRSSSATLIETISKATSFVVSGGSWPKSSRSVGRMTLAVFTRTV